MTVTGSANISGLIPNQTNAGPLGSAGIGVGTATWISGASSGYFDQYEGFTSTPTNFGTGSGISASSGSGDVVGVIFQGSPPYYLVVPHGYTSGSPISSTQTFNNQSFSSLGLTQGTYTYVWSTDSLNVVVGSGISPAPSPAPTPAPSPAPSPTPPSSGSGQWILGSAPYGYNPATHSGETTWPNHTTHTGIVDPTLLVSTASIYINPLDSSSTDQSALLDLLIGHSGTITFTQGAKSATFSFQNNTFSSQAFGPGPNIYFWDANVGGGGSPANLSLVSSTGGAFTGWTGTGSSTDSLTTISISI
jgi:hypothetical protein